MNLNRPLPEDGIIILISRGKTTAIRDLNNQPIATNNELINCIEVWKEKSGCNWNTSNIAILLDFKIAIPPIN